MKDFKAFLKYEKPDLRILVGIAYEKKRLSIVGDIYENNRDVGGGQCYEELLRNFPESARLVEIWERWHLNDMNAGDELQEAYLRALKVTTGWQYTSYENTCSELTKAGIWKHDGYMYGSAWKFEAVPETILTELKEIIKKTNNF